MSPHSPGCNRSVHISFILMCVLYFLLSYVYFSKRCCSEISLSMTVDRERSRVPCVPQRSVASFQLNRTSKQLSTPCSCTILLIMKRSLVLVAAILLQCLAMVYAEATDAKTQRLAKMAKNNNGLVKLTSNTYTQFTEGKRNYGMVVLLTALGDYFNCGPCR